MEAAAGVVAPELSFAVEDGGVLEHAAVPTLLFRVRVESTGEVRSLSLSVQLRIAAPGRTYADGEEERLRELFGAPEQWGRSLRSLHWTTVAVNVPAFSGTALVELPVTCTYDLEVTAAGYLSALADGEVPLEFLFGGTLFYAGPDGLLQVSPVAWSAEAGYRLPVSVWREMMNRFFPDTAWLRLRRDTFDRLRAYRARHSLLGWEEAIESLLRRAG
jgi:Family of unknown function (DUF6084)